MAALNAALALAQVHDVAVLVAEHLEFDMAGMLDEFFEIDVGHAKGLLRLVARGLQTPAESRRGCAPRAFRGRRRPRRP